MTTRHVACAADQNYVGHCAAMLDSLFLSNPDSEFHIHFLHPPTFDRVDRDRLEQFVVARGGRISFWPIPDRDVAGLPTMAIIPKAMWYRIFLPDLLPHVDRVLYLDADTLVVDDIGPLFTGPLDGAYVAAVANVLEPEFADRAQRLGLPASQTYFNSGVLVLNLEAMRADRCTDHIVQYARSESLHWPDQDALNVVLGARCILLHPRWNCMNSLYLFAEARDVFADGEVDEACARPAIVHFEGPQFMKPWHYLSKHPYRSTYLTHRAATPWPDVAIQGRTLSNRMLRPLPTTTRLLVLERWYHARNAFERRAASVSNRSSR
ncbi:MAG TPA: glycosyltransferase family 8 protein [Acidimicrobiia bacterium]